MPRKPRDEIEHANIIAEPVRRRASERRIKRWWPEGAYRSKPYIALGLAYVLALGSVVLSIVRADWGQLALVCGSGCALLIYGGVIIQLRHEYRRRSKWPRHDSEHYHSRPPKP
jgi:hypothetical protein